MLPSCIHTINYDENEDENEKYIPLIRHNRPRPRHGHRYSKYKKCLTMMMLICIKQHLSNISSLIHERAIISLR